MENALNVIFIFNNQEIHVSMQNNDSVNLPAPILNSLLINQHRYEIQSNVSDEVFNSFITYFNQQILPGVPLEPLDEYEILNQELCVPTFQNLIQMSRDTITQRINAIQTLNDDSVADKTAHENLISQNLDFYIENYGEQLINAPIASLCKIFSSKNSKFSLHDRLYELIFFQYQRSNDSQIFTLLRFIDGSLLTRQNSSDSVANQKTRYGFLPKFNVLDIKSRINELEFSNEVYRSIWNEAKAVGQNGDLESIRAFFSESVFNMNGVDFVLNMRDLTAKALLTDEKINEIFVPSSISNYNVDFLVTSIGCKDGCSCLTKMIAFSEDSKIKCIDLDDLNCPLLETIKIPPSVEKLKIKIGNKKIYVILSPNNHHFTFTDDGLLLGKSNVENENFDLLVYSDKNIKKITIPSIIKRIEPYCFALNRKLKSIEFPHDSQLESIGSYAFVYCAIESISIPQHTVEIGDNAFKWCSKLTSIRFAENSELLSIGSNAFDSTAIETITIPPHVTEIKSQTFVNCSKLTSIQFAENSELRSIESNSFDTIAIETITIPPHVTEIKSQTFINCEKLRNIRFAENSELLSIEEKAFYFTNIEEITIPPHVTCISKDAFNGCEKLRIIQFAQNSELRSIKENAFSSTGITSITIPSNVEQIDGKSFLNVLNLNNINVSPDNRYFTIINDGSLLLRKADQNINQFDIIVLACNNLQSITIPSYIKRINSYSFSLCRNLQNVQFADNSELQIIEDNAFSGTMIQNIIIPVHVKEIQSNAFCNCPLLSVVFSENSELEKIGRNSFAFCRITEISIPPHIMEIQAKTFYNCKNLERVQFANNSELHLIGESAFESTAITSIIIPCHVVMINVKAFCNCNNLQQVQFADNSELCLIGKSVFESTAITSIVIPCHVTVIKEKAFYNCNNLQQVQFSDNSELFLIGESAFESTAIVSIVIPKHTSEINDYAFYKCPNLQQIEFLRNSELRTIGRYIFNSINIRSFTIPPNVEEIKENAFSEASRMINFIISPNNHNFSILNDNLLLGKSDRNSDNFDTILFARDNLSHVVIPSYIKQIQSHCFYLNTNLRTIEFEPNSLLNLIGSFAFSKTSIESIIIPQHVTEIKESVFTNCSSLRFAIFSQNSELQKIGDYAFSSSAIYCITIPPHVIEIGKQAFSYCPLRIITFSENSELQVIGEDSFRSSSIESIIIPKHVTVIKNGTFYNCRSLQNVQFADDSELRVIEENVFGYSTVSSISIPLNVNELKECCFCDADNLINIIVSPGNSKFCWFENSLLLGLSNPNSVHYDTIIFARTDLETVIIPPYIKKIEPFCFYYCRRKLRVEFLPNNELQVVGYRAFNNSTEFIRKPINIIYAGPSSLMLSIRDDTSLNSNE